MAHDQQELAIADRIQRRVSSRQIEASAQVGPNQQALVIAGPMEAPSSSRGMGSAHREAYPQALDTAGHDEVSDAD